MLTLLWLLAAHLIVARRTFPRPARPPRWAVRLRGCGLVVYWTRPTPDGLTFTIPAGRQSRGLARYLNGCGATPDDIELYIVKRDGGAV